jgi:hypothetical protein
MSNDIHTYYVENALTAKIDGESKTVGKVVFTYQVRAYVDLRNDQEIKSYLVRCNQRVMIRPINEFLLTPPSNNGFSEYPAMLSALTQLIVPEGVMPVLLDYSPRTLNTAVQTTSNLDDSTNQSTSHQHSLGSSISQTNSYGASLNLGFFGTDPTGGISGDYSHSTTQTRSVDDMTGHEGGSSSAAGISASMSIKDWGAYASLGDDSCTPTWIWGQEYPWDVIQYRYAKSGGNVCLPQFIVDRLIDSATGVVMPPSHLSLFGIDFTMHALWQVPPEYGTVNGDMLNFKHVLNLITGSHSATPPPPPPPHKSDTKKEGSTPSPPAVDATLSNPISFAFDSVPAAPLDLCLLGLDAVTSSAPGNGALIGFVPNKFLIPPTLATPFKITSGSNNMQVTGSGFSFVDGGLPLQSTAGQVASLEVHFKVLDDTEEYSIYFKHWRLGTGPLTFVVIINDEISSTIAKFVDAGEGEGGENNLLSISLRNLDFSSTDYHDYLRRGVNKVRIDVAPLSGNSSAVYCLRALALSGPQ